MEKLCKKLTKLLDKPEEYLRPSDKLQVWVEQARNVYNFVKDEEEKYNLPASTDSLPHLNTDGLDTEQIWQLLELQNKTLLAAPDDLDGLDDVNLCYNVAKLSSLAKYDKLMVGEEEESKHIISGDEDSVLSESSDMEGNPIEEGSDKDEDDEDEGMGSSENLEEDELSDEEMFKNASDIDGGLNLVFDDDSDKEVDNFDDLIAPEGMEDSDDDDDDRGDAKRSKVGDGKAPKDEGETSEEEEKEEGESKKVTESSQKTKRFRKTEVDSKFFRLRECEWVADNDVIGDNYDIDSEDIDLMQDISDGEDGEDGAMYDAFFDGGRADKSAKSKDPLQEDDSEDDDGSEESEGEHDEDMKGLLERNDAQVDGASSNEKDTKVTQLLGLKKKEEKSTFEKERERELMLMSTLEEDNISEKPWFLKGEAVSADRPENSTLEEQLEYNVVARQRPVITEDTTTLVEKIILNRIRAKAWDDVARKVKLTANPFEYKKKLLLDQDKSKKSLAEIYEEEYLKQQTRSSEGKPEEELPEHKEITERMDKLFGLLDALSNYHYTPKMVMPEVKIQSNLPAVTMEEATPITASDATLLAPQEILAPVQGELRGTTELTDTDRKRERRSKKSIQKKKSKMEAQKLQGKIAASVNGGKRLDRKTTLNVVQKAVKAGQVKLLEGQQHKAVKTSQSFFKKLQETQSSHSSKFNKPKAKKNGKGKNAASKLLL